MLRCLNARTSGYKKQDVILLEGQRVTSVGIVTSGTIQIVKEDFQGNRNIMAECEPGSLFAESYACMQADHLPVTVLSAAESEILWIDSGKIISACTSACRFHVKLIENMMTILAAKNVLLNRKIEYLSKRTTREKLLAYLSDQAAECDGYAFDIPFNRQELADYLCVDRSALSGTLSKLQKEGILEFHLNHFLLK